MRPNTPGISKRSLVLMGVAAALWAENVIMAQDDIESVRKVALVTYVYTVADNLDFYMTIERQEYDGEHESAFELLHPVGGPVKSVDELIIKLRKTFKGVAVVKDKKNPKIVHLIDERLTGKPGYPLEQKASINFKGVLADLTAELGKQVPGLAPRSSGCWRDNWDDHVTETSIEAKDAMVRQILTDAVPLKNRVRVLWIAETSHKDGKWRTQAQFTGPQELDKK